MVGTVCLSTGTAPDLCHPREVATLLLSEVSHCPMSPQSLFSGSRGCVDAFHFLHQANSYVIFGCYYKWNCFPNLLLSGFILMNRKVTGC